ncbi:hypothetical protein BURK2_00218 [Burkholderiales bacterium]|nr:MAG: DUF3079 domain-containing protein [Burkholderiales bacterium]CAG0951402.1 hypothetical protein BURK2_00218 [Burkholderiales bacterium]
MSKPRKKIVLHPKYPERICWGCERYCVADDLACGNGTERTPHPAELFGEDWYAWALAVPEVAAAKVAAVEVEGPGRVGKGSVNSDGNPQ